MPLLILLVLLIVIGIPLALCYDNLGKKPNCEGSKKLKVFIITMLYGLLGIILSLILFYILMNLLKPIGTEAPIVIAIIILCSTICSCSAWIVQTIKNSIK